MNNEVLAIIGNKEQTDIFVINQGLSEMLKVDSISNRNARKRERDLVSDSPGRVVKDNGFGSRSVGTEHRAVDHLLDIYVADILKCIEEKKRLTPDLKILLVSEPGFLGLLKKHFERSKLIVSKTISKELSFLDEKDIFSKIKEDIKYL